MNNTPKSLRIDRADKTTEAIIQNLVNESISPHIGSFAEKVGIPKDMLLAHLSFLELHDVAKFEHTAKSNTVKKLDNFNSVVKAGSMQKYLDKQDEKEQFEKARNETDFELKLGQLEDVKTRLKTAERQIKYQNLFWVLTSLGTVVALLKSCGVLGN